MPQENTGRNRNSTKGNGGTGTARTMINDNYKRKITSNAGFRKTAFYPKTPVRSFRDLEVYQKTAQASIDVMKKIMPAVSGKYPMSEKMTACMLTIPNLIAEAHSRRFEDEKGGLRLLDESMAECNKMVVYLEQGRDLYSNDIERTLCEELIRSYIHAREKIFRLFKAWKRFQEEHENAIKK